MVPLAVIAMILVFITADVLIRIVMQKREQSQLKKQRAEALDKGLKLDFSEEAASLKRVELEKPKARILAVDDEEVVLASFRKLLVYEGFAVDTVERGPEALTLVTRNPYDFVLVDLKMPDMNGVEVCKAVKHLRPDVDVVIVTGYASVDTAVETMKFGAMDYFQKPFTEEELIAFLNKCLVRREDRLEKEKKPILNLKTEPGPSPDSVREYDVPAGLFVTGQHTWLSIQPSGGLKIGLDDFALKNLGDLEEIELPVPGQEVSKGDPLFYVKRGGVRVGIPSPVSGKVEQVNEVLAEKTDQMRTNPYELGWVCRLDVVDLSADLASLKLGVKAISWYEEEVARLVKMEKAGGATDSQGTDAERWNTFTREFLGAA